MTEDELKAHIKRELDNSFGYVSGELANERARAMDYFLGEPRGDEVEGRSKIISTDLSDVLSWLLPSVVRAFGSGDEIASFIAYGEEDEERAEQESEFCNYVLFRKQSGFITLYQWFQDALLQKTGYVKVYWDDTPETERKSYENITDEELAALTGGGTEIIEQETLEIENPNTLEIVRIHNVTVERVIEPGRLVIDPIPPEEVRVNPDHKAISLKKARFVAHEREITASEMVEMGFSKEIVDGLPKGEGSVWGEEKEARYNLEDERVGEDSSDPALRKITYAECYPLVDFDGDGIAERRNVIYAGNEILMNEEKRRVCVIALTPFPLSHKHHGRSLYDKLKEIQDHKTAIMRQITDNLYLANNSRHAIVQGQVNITDLLNNRPGGIVRQRQPGMIEQLKAPSVGPEAYGFLEYLDKQREIRSGVGPEITTEIGQLAEQTAWGIERLMSAKEEVKGLIISVFRETGVNELFEVMHETLRENQDWVEPVLMNKWQNINPSQWPARKVKSTAVWTGVGEKIQRQRALGGMMQTQQQLMSSPHAWMVPPPKMYELLSDFAKASGIDETYVLDPTSPQGQQAYQMMQQAQQNQPPPPELLKIQVDQERVGIERERLGIEQRKAELDAHVKVTLAQSKEREAQLKAEVEELKANVLLRRQVVDESSQIMNARTTQQAQQVDAVLRAQKQEMEKRQHAVETAMDRYKAELDALVKFRLEAMKTEEKRDAEIQRLTAELTQVREGLKRD